MYGNTTLGLPTFIHHHQLWCHRYAAVFVIANCNIGAKSINILAACISTLIYPRSEGMNVVFVMSRFKIVSYLFGTIVKQLIADKLFADVRQ